MGSKAKFCNQLVMSAADAGVRNDDMNAGTIGIYFSSPQSFKNLRPVSWKKIFPRTRVVMVRWLGGRWFWCDSVEHAKFRVGFVPMRI